MGCRWQGLTASSRSGLSELEVTIRLVAVGQVQLPSTLGLGADDRVQADVLAGPGQLYIQPVDVFSAGQPDQGSAAQSSTVAKQLLD